MPKNKLKNDADAVFCSLPSGTIDQESAVNKQRFFYVFLSCVLTFVFPADQIPDMDQFKSSKLNGT